MLETLKERAREIGGDAILAPIVTKTTQSFGIGWKDYAEALVYRDTGIPAPRP